VADFGEIYSEYFSDVYKYVLSLCMDEAVAEEVTQETFFKAMQHINKFNGSCKLYVWLCQIAKNTYFTLYKKKKRIVSDLDIDIPDISFNLETDYLDKGQAHLLGLYDNSKIEEVLKTVGLENANNKPVSHFSLGMTQRLKLAMALLQNPDILILDEPMNGLDPDGIADLRELLLHLHGKGTTILVSSHILSELEQVATHLGILHDGKIVKEVSTHDAFQNGTSLETLYMQYTRGGKPND
jgi:RNA polymerase sigma factor (sigma-70 family)